MQENRSVSVVLSRESGASITGGKSPNLDGTIDGTTDTNITMPTVDRLILGNDDDSNTNSLHGHIRRFMYYPVKLSDSQVVTLTS